MNERSDPCATCGEGVFKCSGHFGHIDLPIPVVNPLFVKPLCSLIKLSCLQCFKLQIPAHAKLLLSAKFKLIEEGYHTDLEGLEQEVNTAVASVTQMTEGYIEYIRELIDTYIETLRNRRRYDRSIVRYNENAQLNTKNVNMIRDTHIDCALKQFSVGRVCIYCSNSIPKITIMKNKIMTTKIIEEFEE